MNQDLTHQVGGDPKEGLPLDLFASINCRQALLTSAEVCSQMPAPLGKHGMVSQPVSSLYTGHVVEGQPVSVTPRVQEPHDFLRRAHRQGSLLREPSSGNPRLRPTRLYG